MSYFFLKSIFWDLGSIFSFFLAANMARISWAVIFKSSPLEDFILLGVSIGVGEGEVELPGGVGDGPLELTSSSIEFM